MSRALSRRGRMRHDDEQRIQVNSLFIEQEIDGGDLAPTMYASTIIDTNDKDEIMAGRTRLDRTRRLLDIILLRGHDAFEEFLLALEGCGYDHVAFRIRNTTTGEGSNQNSFSEFHTASLKLAHNLASFVTVGSSMTTSGPSEGLTQLARSTTAPDNVFLTCSLDSNSDSQTKEPSTVAGKSCKRGGMGNKRDSESSQMSIDSDQEGTCNIRENKRMSESEKGNKITDERLKRIEDAWFILSRRVTRVEDRVTKSSDVPEEELHIIKEELADLKTDTLLQVQELTQENEHKAAIIQTFRV